MPVFTIAFDFPENDDPWFCGSTKDGLGFTSCLAASIRFGSEAFAVRVLENGYGPEARQYGAVVEVPA